MDNEHIMDNPDNHPEHSFSSEANTAPPPPTQNTTGTQGVPFVTEGTSIPLPPNPTMMRIIYIVGHGGNVPDLARLGEELDEEPEDDDPYEDEMDEAIMDDIITPQAAAHLADWFKK